MIPTPAPSPTAVGIDHGATEAAHPRGRETYGHSLIVSPWGEVLADGGVAPGNVYAEIDVALVDKARANIPSLSHERTFSAPQPQLQPKDSSSTKGAV